MRFDKGNYPILDSLVSEEDFQDHKILTDFVRNGYEKIPIYIARMNSELHCIIYKRYILSPNSIGIPTVSFSVGIQGTGWDDLPIYASFSMEISFRILKC